MLLTKATRDLATRQVEGIPGNPTSGNPFGADVQKRILNSTVKISGTGWDTSSSFSGSAVIYKVDATYAYVLSAAHNIMVWANIEQKPDDWKKYIDGDNSHNGFVKNVKISYGKGNMTFNQATGESAAEIFSVEVPEVNHDCRTDNCLYDLIAIKSKNNALRTYAKEYVFGKRTYEQIATAVAAEATQVKQSFAAFLNPKKYFFVQLGYGHIESKRNKDRLIQIKNRGGRVVEEKIERKEIMGYCEKEDKQDKESLAILKKNHLHYRLTNPGYQEIKSMYDQEGENGKPPSFTEYAEAISVRARIHSTTAKGDSGGPLYAVARSLDSAFLLGVTTGADMSVYNQDKKEMISNYAFRNCISTSVAPYWKKVF